MSVSITSFSPSIAGPEGLVPGKVLGSGFPISNNNNQIIIELCGNKVTTYTLLSNN